MSTEDGEGRGVGEGGVVHIDKVRRDRLVRRVHRAVDLGQVDAHGHHQLERRDVRAGDALGDRVLDL